MDIEPIQVLTPRIRRKPVHLFDLDWVPDYNRWDRKASAVISKRTPDALQIRYWATQKGKARVTIETKDGRTVYDQRHKSRPGINVLDWDLQVDREAELTWQLEQAQKEQQEAQDKLDKAHKAAADETESEAVDKDDSTEHQAQDTDKVAELLKKLEESVDKVEALQRVIDEAETYAKQPPETRDRMVRTVYVTEGAYSVTVKLGADTASQSLQVGGERPTPDKLDTKKKRTAETKRLLKDYEIDD